MTLQTAAEDLSKSHFHNKYLVFCKLSLSANLKKPDNPICYCSGVLKLKDSKTESRRWQTTIKQIGRSASDATHSLEIRCEFHEESTQQRVVTCGLLPFPKGTIARIWKAIVEQLKKFIVRLLFLLWLHFPFTH